MGKRYFPLLMAAAMPFSSVNAEEKIGISDVSVNQVVARSENRGFNLASGDSILRNMEISTGLESVNIDLFEDGTKLSIGPESTVVLDSFIYDPDKKTGELAIELGKGTLRWVSGELNSSSYRIKTPFSAVGVRGTSFVLSHEEETGSIIVVESGNVSFQGAARTEPVDLASGMAGVVKDSDSPAESYDSASSDQVATVASLNVSLATLATPAKAVPAAIATLGPKAAASAALAASTPAMETGSSDFGGSGKY